MITGSLVAIVTPMSGNGEPDWESMHALVEHHIDQGTDGIVVVGTTGESATLTAKEHGEVIKRVVDQVNGRIPVIAGSGSNSTAETVYLSAEARALGVDACLLVTPYYNRPTQEGLYLHYKTVAESVAIPQILYNVPGRTGVDLLPETVARLSQLDNIVGIKEATGIVERGRQIRALCGDNFAIYSGDDATGMELMLQGANGVVSVVNNVAPKIMHDLCVAAMKGDRQQAETLNARIAALSSALFLEANPIPVKWALREMGMIQEGIRLPLTPLSECYHNDVRQALQVAELI